jgi:CheY-like chemotaxis protein
VLVGDPGRLRQVLTNLVGNALKFTDRGEVFVDVDTASQTAEDVCLQFTVRDTGMGIPAEKQQCIFEPFTQVNGSTTRRHGGTGLGLAISSHLVALMRGQLWVESEIGKGSAFHFTAPFHLPVEAAGPARQELAADQHGLRVLVVDDNATNRRILEELLTGWRLRPVLADGGPPALAALKDALGAAEPFGLVLLDAHMPEVDGFTLARRIRSTPELTGTPLLMLTSAGHPEEIARCRELGIAVHLMKPVKPSELLDGIVRTLGGTAVRAPACAAPAAPLDGRCRLRVLLAEDNPVNQKLAVRLLENQGHTVVVAENGAQALAALEGDPFDLVLMDLQMPEMDGFEATAFIRRKEQGTGRHLPIIAMTAHALKGDRERCLAAGMDDYVSKPIQPETLFEAIARVSAALPHRGLEIPSPR